MIIQPSLENPLTKGTKFRRSRGSEGWVGIETCPFRGRSEMVLNVNHYASDPLKSAVAAS